MNIGILAVDSNYPNLALMKISSYHKVRGDNVEWYNPLCHYDKVYAAKVFSLLLITVTTSMQIRLKKVEPDMIFQKYFR